ncbi:MAG: hypothetical protein EOP49_42560, partial [Sphingobacteriales bacterium]
MPLETLIAIHLHTHSCTSSHGMREKYRSAVYTFSELQQSLVTAIIQALQTEFNEPIVIEVVPFGSFKLNHPQYLNYYYADPEKPFCKNIVNPKLIQLLRSSENADTLAFDEAVTGFGTQRAGLTLHPLLKDGGG